MYVRKCNSSRRLIYASCWDMRIALCIFSSRLHRFYEFPQNIFERQHFGVIHSARISEHKCWPQCSRLPRKAEDGHKCDLHLARLLCRSNRDHGVWKHPFIELLVIAAIWPWWHHLSVTHHPWPFSLFILSLACLCVVLVCAVPLSCSWSSHIKKKYLDVMMILSNSSMPIVNWTRQNRKLAEFKKAHVRKNAPRETHSSAIPI